MKGLIVSRELIEEVDTALTGLGVLISRICGEAKMDADKIEDILADADYGREALEIINDEAQFSETRGLDRIVELRLKLQEVLNNGQ